MSEIYSIALLIVAATGAWAFLSLRQRISFLEHEVRWLRSELDSLKPTEVRSIYD
ncbi:MAG: hypothetical protein ACR2PG_05530 [Hyphomicrobiaceae bacterium]